MMTTKILFFLVLLIKNFFGLSIMRVVEFEKNHKHLMDGVHSFEFYFVFIKR
jgi:hypothetical protein